MSLPPLLYLCNSLGLWSRKYFLKSRKEKDTQCLNFSGFSCYFHCLDPGPYFSVAGTRADANSDTPACSGGLGKASSGICPSSCGLLAGGHDPAYERCRDQRGNWTATKNSRYLPTASCCMPFPGGHAVHREPFLLEMVTALLCLNTCFTHLVLGLSVNSLRFPSPKFWLSV